VWEVLTYLRPIIQNNTRLVLIFPVLSHSMTKMNRDPQLILRMIKNNAMQFAAMAIENRCLGIRWRAPLRCDNFSSIVFMNSESIFGQVDTQPAHLFGDFAVGPAFVDATSIGTEGDYVA
jgi:hypothetical protein